MIAVAIFAALLGATLVAQAWLVAEHDALNPKSPAAPALPFLMFMALMFGLMLGLAVTR